MLPFLALDRAILSLLVATSLFVFQLAPASAGADDEDLAKIFAQHRLEGTMVIEKLDGSARFEHNSERAARPMLPASTFKILHSLIVLDEGVLSRPSDVIKWDGTDHGWRQWNQDQSFLDAFRVSCVWCYVGFTKSISNERYLQHLEKARYGNMKTGADHSTFWLKGDLAISANEQIDFLRRFYNEELEYKSEHFAIVKHFMFNTVASKKRLYSKTGWALRKDGQHVWNVGFVETESDVWLFAVNFALTDKKQAQLRKRIALDALMSKGIW